MSGSSRGSRRQFIAGCACAACAGAAVAAQPSSRNAKSLKESAATNGLSAASAPGKRSFDIAYCGIYCAACELHLKGKKDGKKCKGCTHPSMESKCAVFACAKERKVESCGLCASFETCETLAKHHEKPLYRQAARRTCARIKAEGVEKVRASLQARWTCKSCGKLYPWNTAGSCPECGKAAAPLSEQDA